MTTLYKQNKNGSIQSWSIETQTHGVYTVTFGQLGGAMQTQSTQCSGKNIGKANETTPDQQAELEMQALITKKLKSGYSYDQSAPVTVQLPMKVKCYQDQLNNVKFPCISQPKLNGVNGLYRRSGSTLTLYSRGGEVYPAIPHLEPLVHHVMNYLGCNELNGELYIHRMPLQDIQSAVTKPNDKSHLLSFCVFDISDSTATFEQRFTAMQSCTLANFRGHSQVAIIPGIMCHSHTALDIHYEDCMSQYFEGTVIKNLDGLYQHNIRSSDQFKYKKALSKEFLIAGFELDKRGHPVFHLFINFDSPKVFKAKPKGTHEFLESINPQSYVGSWATIEYETLSKDNVPLKPIFIGLRNCDESGNPME